MILFNIIQDNEAKAEAISSFLIEKNYALQTHIDVNSVFTGNLKRKTIRLFFITKSLLYSKIEQEIKDKFFSDEMIIYATPISHINEEFGELFRSQLKVI